MVFTGVASLQSFICLILFWNCFSFCTTRVRHCLDTVVSHSIVIWIRLITHLLVHHTWQGKPWRPFQNIVYYIGNPFVIPVWTELPDFRLLQFAKLVCSRVIREQTMKGRKRKHISLCMSLYQKFQYIWKTKSKARSFWETDNCFRKFIYLCQRLRRQFLFPHF